MRTCAQREPGVTGDGCRLRLSPRSAAALVTVLVAGACFAAPAAADGGERSDYYSDPVVPAYPSMPGFPAFPGVSGRDYVAMTGGVDQFGPDHFGTPGKSPRRHRHEANAETERGRTGLGVAGKARHGASGRADSGVANVGLGNTGVGNVGSGNSGIGNVGSGNSGIGNVGSGNSGIGNVGSCNSGVANVGDRNPGIANVGDRNPGIANVGDRNLGIANVGDGRLKLRGTGGCRAAAVAGVSAVRQGTPDELPRTGGNPVPLAVVGLGLVGLGGLTWRLARTRDR